MNPFRASWLLPCLLLPWLVRSGQPVGVEDSHSGVLESTGPPRAVDPGALAVGSKNFAESRLLAEIFAQWIEERLGVEVERKLFAGTKLCFDALRSGDIALYPEYTGTGLVDILGESASGDGVATLARVRSEFLRRYELYWLAPLGFENAYELAVPRELAEERGLRTLTDLARVSETLEAGFGFEFVDRPDGLPGLEELYGLRFQGVRSLQQSAKYIAARERRIDCLDVYTTEGRLREFDLQVLEDDLGFFPPYGACALVSSRALEEHPGLGASLGMLSNLFDEERMRALNHRVEVQGEDLASVATSALVELGLLGEERRASVEPRPGNLLSYLWRERESLGLRSLEHLLFSAGALLLGAWVAIPLGVLLERRRSWAEGVIGLVGAIQTLPSIALLAFMVPLLGTGPVPAIAALFAYSLFPMLRSSYLGVTEADPAACHAARGLGMTDMQVLRWVRLPLAVPSIFSGVRTSAVITVGTATLAAFIGAGGLGLPIVTGLQRLDTLQILSGALPAAAMALGVDALLARIGRRWSPGGS